jgi:hypothetical protein
MNTSRLFSGMLVPLFGLLGGAIARGDAIQPWAGASASTTVFDQTRSQAGAIAGASGTGTQTVHYAGSPVFNPTQYFDITVNGSASAGATGRADDLLDVSAHYNAGNPGTLGYGRPGVSPISATASWSGDQVMVTPPVGGAMPDSVQLQFALTFQAPAGYPEASWQFGSMSVDANGKTIAITPSYESSVGGGPVPMSGDFDSLKLLPTSNSTPYEYVGTFHVDLPLGQSGTSDPFHLALSAMPNTGLASNGGYYADQSGQLALTGVTLPDGTSLSSAGYGVSFASGLMGESTSVPEPTSVACWTLTALVACGLIRRRAACAGGV